jgi:hypothetical protein
MGIPVEHGGDPGPAATLRDHLRIDARPEKLGRDEVSEVVKPALRQAGDPSAEVPVLPRCGVGPPRLLAEDIVRKHVDV